MANDRVKTPKARVSFPSLFKAKAYDEGKEPKFEADLVFPKSADLKALKVMCATALREKFGPDAMNITESENGVAKPGSKGKLWWPIRDGAEKTDKDGKARDGYGPDTVYIKVSSKNKPGIVDQNAYRITDAGDMYGGCYATAYVNAYTYDNKTRGVSIGLQTMQKVAEGEPFGSRSNPEDDFEPITEDDFDKVEDGAEPESVFS